MPDITPSARRPKARALLVGLAALAAIPLVAIPQAHAQLLAAAAGALAAWGFDEAFLEDRTSYYQDDEFLQGSDEDFLF